MKYEELIKLDILKLISNKKMMTMEELIKTLNYDDKLIESVVQRLSMEGEVEYVYILYIKKAR